jgi:UDP-GlcNAc:undecaprenyl-phosphate GlcNAc-1-phosphate transferase
MMLVFLGATMFWLKIPLAGTVVLSTDLTPLITALWVIGITNAINLIDGLDGLAAGIVAIASGALAVYGLRLVELGSLQATNLGPLIAVITCGICLGFLPHNFNPARVFMGDAGALFLGLLMARRTSSTRRCSSRCSSSVCRSRTWPSHMSEGWPRAQASTPRTPTTFTTDS